MRIWPCRLPPANHFSALHCGPHDRRPPPHPEDRVLEIGTGSGYAAAVLSRVVREVYTVERHAELVELARCRMDTEI